MTTERRQGPPAETEAESPVAEGLSPSGGSSLAAEARFDALLAAAVDAIIVISDDGRIQTFSPAAERIFGYGAAEVLGENVRLLMPEPFRAEHDGYLHNYLDSGVAKIIGLGREVQALKKDGTVFPIDLSVGHARIGGESAFVSIIRDLTARKAAEAALHESRRALTTLAENFPGMVYRCNQDAARTMLLASSGTLSLTGYSPEEFMNAEVAYTDLIHADDRAAVGETVDLALGRHQAFDLTYRILTRSGTERWVFERGVGVFCEGSGQIRFIEGFVEDITKRLDAEGEADRLREDLAHVDRLGMMGEMATGIAHEINQPLTAIGNYAQACRFMLQREAVDQELLVETLDKISLGAKRAGEVIRRLRTFVHKRESQRERVAVNDLVGKVAALLENEVRLHDLEIRMELAPSLRAVVADPVQIQQVLLNLLRNGIDAMEGLESSQNRILIETSAQDQTEVEVRVTDHGVGVSEEAGEKLFHPFFTTKESGMGIGLSICHSIVEAHGGRLWFSRNPEAGTTFHFTLPTAIEAPGQ